VPKKPAGTLAVIGDLKQMSANYLRGVSMQGYGVSLSVGIGIPIPVLSEEILRYTTVTDADIYAPVVDYSEAYPQRKADILGEVSYAQLKSGAIEVNGKKVPASSLSSYPKAVEIAETLKSWIQKGDFTLTEPVAALPGPDAGISLKSLEERAVV
jgi:uncharacterized protein (DUF39 family)